MYVTLSPFTYKTIQLVPINFYSSFILGNPVVGLLGDQMMGCFRDVRETSVKRIL